VFRAGQLRVHQPAQRANGQSTKQH
jgi:hypothetical protein